MSEADRRVYIAGPEVFLPDATELLATKKSICGEAGLVGVSPFDNEVSGMDGAEATAFAIYRGNLASMSGCSFAIANITPFRGVSIDPGTAFEVGYMCALGRPVFAYSAEPLEYAARTRRAASSEPLVVRDTAGDIAVEDFGLADNLMIACGVEEGGGRTFVADEPPADRWRDLSLFRACVAEIAAMRARGGD